MSRDPERTDEPVPTCVVINSSRAARWRSFLHYYFAFFDTDLGNLQYIILNHNRLHNSSSMPPDTITISSLTLHLPHGLGPSAFHLTPSPPCPALLSLTIHLVPNSVSATAAGDSMAGLGVNYSSVSKAVYALANDAEKVWSGPWELMRAVSAIPLGFDDVQSVDIRLGLPKALLHALEAVYKASYAKNGQETGRSCTIRDLKVVCIVGLHEHERKEKQRLELDVKVRGGDWNVWGHKGFADEVYDVSCASSTCAQLSSITNKTW